MTQLEKANLYYLTPESVQEPFYLLKAVPMKFYDAAYLAIEQGGKEQCVIYDYPPGTPRGVENPHWNPGFYHFKEGILIKISLLIFDLDGTLTETQSGATFRKTADDWYWKANRLEYVQRLKMLGYKTAVATNQGGVAFGYLDQKAMQAELLRVSDEGMLTPFAVCYNHPSASISYYRKDDPRRKPNGGMLQEIAHELKLFTHEALMVGGREEDRGAAQAAGTAFCWADTFFAFQSPLIHSISQG